LTFRVSLRYASLHGPPPPHPIRKRPLPCHLPRQRPPKDLSSGLQDADRSAFLQLLGRSAEIYQVEVLAYVLMANHFHLLVKTPRANLQEFMRHFNISCTSHFNRAHQRTGHLDKEGVRPGPKHRSKEQMRQEKTASRA
jgi:REP element-mobilizing transposase RayT